MRGAQWPQTDWGVSNNGDHQLSQGHQPTNSHITNDWFLSPRSWVQSEDEPLPEARDRSCACRSRRPCLRLWFLHASVTHSFWHTTRKPAVLASNNIWVSDIATAEPFPLCGRAVAISTDEFRGRTGRELRGISIMLFIYVFFYASWGSHHQAIRNTLPNRWLLRHMCLNWGSNLPVRFFCSDKVALMSSWLPL